MVNKSTSAWVLGLFLVFFPAAGVMADDTELYTNNSAATGGKPLVMFTLDYSPSTFATMCKITDADCAELYKEGYLCLAGETGCTDPVDGTAVKRNELLIAVLKKVMDNIGGMRIGLMMPNANGCKGTMADCSNGASILMGFREIDKLDSNGNKAKFFDKMSAIPDSAALAWNSGSGAISHPYQPKEMFFEMFRYLSGQGVASAHLGYDNFGYKQTKTAIQNVDDFYPDMARDLSIEPGTSTGQYDTAGTYATPLNEHCSKVFTVNFTFNNTVGVDGDLDADINKDKYNQGLQDIGLNGKNNSLTTILRYLNQVDLGADKIDEDSDGVLDNWGTVPFLEGQQNVTSFFVVDTNMKNTGHTWAAAGGTTSAYIWESGKANKLVEDLTSILNQILSVSTTFTAASVPVSVLNRAQVVDNVYIALFRANQSGAKRWPGNVKKLKLDLEQGLLVDAHDPPVSAIGSDGRIEPSAVTYWTKADELPAADTANGEIEGKDGRAVARGGSGQKVPGFLSGTVGATGNPGLLNSDTGARQLYYDDGSNLKAIDADSSTASALWASLGVTDPSLDSGADVGQTLLYMRGYDIYDEDGDTIFKEARDWLVGDPLHSRPLPINYGNRGSFTNPKIPDIRIVYGSNDGYFRMIQNTDALGEQLGTENWAYMPQEVMKIIPLLRDNKLGTHPYGVDGAPAMYYYDKANDGKIVKADGDKVWVYFGLRRGGRGYYALDISDPDNPTFMWKITNATSGFSSLGYSFSQPRVGKVNYDGNGAKPVVMFTGGYDTNKDGTSTSDDTMGNAIFMVDAETGKLVWKAVRGATNANISTTEFNHKDLADSIPSTLTTVDTVGNGVIDRAYVGDTGGRVWRIDFAGSDRTKWYVKKLAELGKTHSGTVAATTDRRFFHRPDFIQYRDSGDYDAIVIASGNRADPLDLRPVVTNDTVKNYLYVIKDRKIATNSITVDPTTDKALQDADLFDATDNCIQDTGCTLTSTQQAQMANGWKMQFEGLGEKSLATPTTLAKKIFVTTFLPPGSGSDGKCEPNEGSGRLYAVSLDDATAVNDYYALNGEALEKEDRYVDLKSGGIPAEVVYVPFNRILKPDLTIENVGISGRWKTYWYKEEN